MQLGFDHHISQLGDSEYFYVVLYLFFSFCGGYIGWSWMPPLDWCSLPASTAQGKCPLSGTQNWTTLENKALSEMTDSNTCMLERFSRIQCFMTLSDVISLYIMIFILSLRRYWIHWMGKICIQNHTVSQILTIWYYHVQLYLALIFICMLENVMFFIYLNPYNVWIWPIGITEFMICIWIFMKQKGRFSNK